MHGAGAPIDGDIEITLAPFAITGLQFRQMFDVDVNKTKIILFKGPFSLDRLGRSGSESTVKPLRFQNAPDAVTIEVWQKMRDHEGEIVQDKVRDPAQSADHRAFFLGRLPGQLVWPGGMILAILDTALPPLADRLGADAVTLSQDAG